MTRVLKPEIQLEQALAGQIYHALEGDVVRFVLKNAQGGTDDDYWRSRMEGHCMKADKNLLGNFYNLCHEVQERLNFQEKVDYYVTGDSSINAFSIAAEDSEHPHIVNVNSELFNLMNEDELKFVIGHELGHLINQDTALRRLIHFVYPPQSTQIPITLQYKIHLHDNLAELVADRYGYIACGNLEACVTAFFKMASGLDLEKMQVSIDDLLSDNSKHLDYFLKGGGMSHYDHPVNPIRVQAINLFASARNQIELDNGMEELIQILLKVGNSPLDEPMSIFVATAGIIAANVDGSVSKEEYEQIIRTLSGSNTETEPAGIHDRHYPCRQGDRGEGGKLHLRDREESGPERKGDLRPVCRHGPAELQPQPGRHFIVVHGIRSFSCLLEGNKGPAAAPSSVSPSPVASRPEVQGRCHEALRAGDGEIKRRIHFSKSDF